MSEPTGTRVVNDPQIHRQPYELQTSKCHSNISELVNIFSSVLVNSEPFLANSRDQLSPLSRAAVLLANLQKKLEK